VERVDDEDDEWSGRVDMYILLLYLLFIQAVYSIQQCNTIYMYTVNVVNLLLTS
jgi:hypothetical protein